MIIMKLPALAIHQQLGFLLDHQPPQMHLVLITREDPLLPLARLRARSQLQEIRLDDLRFTTTETADFLGKIMGLNLSDNEVALLERRTEGWIAGLQLAALSMQGHTDLHGFVQSFTGSSRFVLDYLIEEVFDRQAPDIKEFLLSTSVLEQLAGPLCNAVTQREDGQIFLETLEQANLFIIPLDQSRGWYRYHRLFAELLRNRLRTSRPADEALLHGRASRWYEAEGLTPEAIHHALAAQAWGRAAALIGQAADGLLRRGELLTLVRWFRKIPPELINGHPELGLSFVWALLLSGRYDDAGQLLTLYESAADPSSILLGQIANAQAFLRGALSRG